jgi:signal transduction histidine kinase
MPAAQASGYNDGASRLPEVPVSSTSSPLSAVFAWPRASLGWGARLTWAQRFMLASLVILVLGMLGLGWWVSQEIQTSVVQETADNVALYVSGIVEPNVQELVTGDSITPEHQALLARTMNDTSLGQHITAVKVWDMQGRVVYATDSQDIGRTFPVDADLNHALHGWVAADISTLSKPENINDRDRGQRRLETYSPVRRTGTSQVIGAVEFYQTVDGLDRDLAGAQQRSWLVVGGAALVMFVLLGGFVRYASETIRRQQARLHDQVGRLEELLDQNDELHERVRRAARRTTALNERFLRRISAELHDGPAQDLGLALLRLNHLEPQPSAAHGAPAAAAGPDFHVVQSSLQHALTEIRAISAGLGLPELQDRSPEETVGRAVRSHEQRTGTRVALRLSQLPGQLSLPVKITLYRVIQEALSNAYRHAGASGQEVCVEGGARQLTLTVADRGPGFDQAGGWEQDEHLGLAGMRERLESLGGTFKIDSAPGQGTRIIAQLPLDPPPGSHER